MSSQPPPDKTPMSIDDDDDDDPEVQAAKAALEEQLRVAKAAARERRKREAEERERAEAEARRKEAEEAERAKRAEAEARARSERNRADAPGTPSKEAEGDAQPGKGKKRKLDEKDYTETGRTDTDRVFYRVPCERCLKGSFACFFPPEVSESTACRECRRLKLKCRGAVHRNPTKKTRRETKKAEAKGSEVRGSERAETAPVVGPSGLGAGSASVASRPAEIAEAFLRDRNADPADTRATEAELSRREVLWPMDTRVSNMELLYALLIETQAIRREMAALRAEMQAGREQREQALAEYFGDLLGELREERDSEFSAEGTDAEQEEQEGQEGTEGPEDTEE
ncbi:hypothetical protein BV20DRAFT_976040 [Pilatotrama ljubarskyi]|nr:hypothetical protein BV20DRAFT_976040 [Pilatotrama ljubarskyi]